MSLGKVTSCLAALLFTLIAGSNAVASPASKETDRAKVIALAAQIRTADYEGRRDDLTRLHKQLDPYVKNSEMASRVRYWQGFALWRRAINGFNETPTPSDLEQDLRAAVLDFEAALALDPKFVDAEVGASSCLFSIAFLHRAEPSLSEDAITRGVKHLNQAKAEDPDNPRLLWIVGGGYYYLPPEHGGSQAKALETYQRGLELIRADKSAHDPLDPTWGEPELLIESGVDQPQHEWSASGPLR